MILIPINSYWFVVVDVVIIICLFACHPAYSHKGGKTALIQAASPPNAALLALLVEHGANVNAFDEVGFCEEEIKVKYRRIRYIISISFHLYIFEIIVLVAKMSLVT